MDFESQIEKIAKDIRDREDREMALAFTNVVGSLLRENGVFVKTSRYEFETDNESDKNKYIIKKEYGVSFDGLDFTEHDKMFNDKIGQLKHELEKTYNQLMEVEKESQERIAELESELEVKDNLLKIKNGLCKPPMMTVVVAKTINGQDYVRLEDFISVVNDLQNYDLYHAE